MLGRLIRWCCPLLRDHKDSGDTTREQDMTRHFTLEYWVDENWYVGKLNEVPGVFGQGER